MQKPRVLSPERRQVRLIPSSLEEALPSDHPVRGVWAYVDSMDLEPLYGGIKSIEGAPGRPATDPKLLFALWVFATTEGIGSARALAELCTRDLPYQWLCGGVPVNYHTLSDFRSKNEHQFRQVLAGHVVSLVSAGVVALTDIAHDGVRVRANAGTGSFRARSRLRALEREVRQRITRLSQEVHDDPAATSRRQQAARERADKERARRIREAIERTEERDRESESAPSHKSKAAQAAAQDKRDAGDTKASTTDADATIIKMADGGFRPGFNVQTSIDPHSGFVLEVGISTDGNDRGKLAPAIERVEGTYKHRLERVAADGGFVKRSEIEALESKGVRLHMPVQARGTRDKFADTDIGDTPGVASWRRRMNTPEGREFYSLRPLVEWVFARFRNWGLQQFPVRGRSRVASTALLYSLTHNIVIARGR
jgi:transposase